MNRDAKQISDEELEQALRCFRQSVTEWSATEASRAESGAGRETRPTPKWLSWWMVMGAAGATVAACALAAVMLSGGHRTEPQPTASVMRQAAPSAEDAKQNAAATTGESASPENRAVTLDAGTAQMRGRDSRDTEDADEELLAGIDNDIARGTPKALAPMAGWMSDSAER